MFTRTIGEELKAADNYFFDKEALPNNTSKLSETLLVGGNQQANEIVIVAEDEITIPDGKALKIFMLAAPTPVVGSVHTYGGAIYERTASGAAETVEAGEVLTRFVPPSDCAPYGRLKVTSTSDLSAAKISAYPVLRAK